MHKYDLEKELEKVIFPSDKVRGEILECDVIYRDDPDRYITKMTVASYPWDEDPNDMSGWGCDENGDLAKMCDPDNTEFDIQIIAFCGTKAEWLNKAEKIDDKATAKLEYGEDGKATLSIRNGNGTLVFRDRVEDCHNLWGEFYLCGELFKFNFFDQPNDYGVGCWVYPNGDTDNEITLDVEIYENGKLVRKNQ